MKYTTNLAAQNTSVKVCDIIRRREADDWIATVVLTGTFGSGTVSLQISTDGGTTKATLNQEGTATAASATAAIALNIKCGNSSTNEPAELYATIATATNPDVDIVVYDNR